MAKTNVDSKIKKLGKKLALVLVLGFGLAGAQVWLWDFVSNMAERLHENQSQRRQIEEIEKRVSEMRKDQAKRQAEIGSLEQAAPRQGNTLQVLDRLETVAQQNGLVLEVTNIAEAVATTGGELARVLALPVTVRASGAPTALLTYVDAVENTPELTQVELLTLAPTQGAVQATGSHTLTLEVSFYFQDYGDDVE